MRRKYLGIVSRLANGWKWQEEKVTWLLLQVEWLRIVIGDNE